MRIKWTSSGKDSLILHGGKKSPGSIVSTNTRLRRYLCKSIAGPRSETKDMTKFRKIIKNSPKDLTSFG